MARSTSARVLGGTNGQVSLASPVVVEVDAQGGNQITVLAKHVEGTSATALTCVPSLVYDASTTAARALNGHLGTTNIVFPLPEENVGSTASSVTTVTINSRTYSFGADYLDAALPPLFFPISGSGPCKLRLTFTETASAAGTIGVAVLSDDD